MIDAISTGAQGQPSFITGNGGGDGMGSSIWAIVLIALLGFGRGGCGGNDVSNEVDFAEINNRIDNVNALAEQRATLKESCDTHMAVLNLGREGVENKYETSLQLKDMQMANAQCYAA